MTGRNISMFNRVLLLFVLIVFHKISHAQNFEAGLSPELISELAALPNQTSRIDLLLKTSDKLMQKDPTQAITLTLYALTLARKVDAETQVDQALSKAGKILQLNGAYDKAMDYYNEYYQRALKSDNLKNQLRARHNIASLKMTISDKFDNSVFDEMTALLKEYEQIWESERDSVFINEFIPGILINLNHMAQLRDSLEEAGGYLRRIRRLAEQNLLSEQLQLQLSISEIALFIQMGKYKEALDQTEMAKTLCKLNTNQVMDASIDFYAGNAWLGMGNWKMATESYKKCYSKGEQLGNFILVAEAASKLSTLYEQNAEPELALKYKNIAEQAKAAMQKPEAAAKANSAQMLEKLNQLEVEMEQLARKSTFRQKLLLAVLFLLGIGGATVYSMSRKTHQKISEEKRSLEQQSESAIQEIEALGSELENKDKLLATEMMYRLQQQEQIKDIRQRLLLVNRHAKKEVKEELEKVIKGIDLSSEDISWKDFEIRFLNVHQDFYDRLHAINPKLTGNERRLCAFLKMGFNTKEISTITGQTQQSIIMSRHRLRKKLGLEHQNTSFDEFFATM